MPAFEACKAAAAVFLALLPAAPLLGQQDGAMEKEHGTMGDHAAMTMPEPSLQGTLTGVGNHKATGTVHLVNGGGKRQVHFTSDLSAEKGPDLYVSLTNGPKPVKGPANRSSTFQQASISPNILTSSCGPGSPASLLPRRRSVRPAWEKWTV